MKRTAVVTLAVLALTTSAFAAASFTFGGTIPANSGHRLVLLPDGKVFVSGSSLRTHIYDPVTQIATQTASTDVPHAHHVAALLDNGLILQAGGDAGGLRPVAITTCHLYNRATNTNPQTGAFVVAQRMKHVGHKLLDGRVLVCGGQNPTQSSLASCEMYNPATGTWSAAGSVASLTVDQHSVLLTNGKMMLAANNVALYDPITQTSAVGPALSVPRRGATLTRLLDGRVLIAGGENQFGNLQATAEVYNPSTNTLSPPISLTSYRYRHTATLLTNGKVLITGGEIGSTRLNTAEIYDPVTNAFSATVPMNVARSEHEAIRLLDGRVLLVGAARFGSEHRTELYDYGDGTTLPPPNNDPVPGPGPLVAGFRDFSGDGKSDVIWRNSSTGRMVAWLMNGTAASSVDLTPYSNNSPNNFPAAMGDFDGNGICDIWFRSGTNSVNNQIWLFTYNAVVAKIVTVQIQPDPNFRIVGAGDVDNDGTDDIIWTNDLNGANMIWRMQNGQVAGTANILTLPESWYARTVGDYNGDGKADMFLRNYITGENFIWILDGMQVVNGSLTVRQQDTSFDVEPSYDFNGDGRTDVIWRRDSTGETVVWFMNQFQVINGSHIPRQWNDHWRIATVADFNNDGRADVFWRNVVSGGHEVWLFNGFTVTDASSLPPVTEANWSIIKR